MTLRAKATKSRSDTGTRTYITARWIIGMVGPGTFEVWDMGVHGCALLDGKSLKLRQASVHEDSTKYERKRVHQSLFLQLELHGPQLLLTTAARSKNLNKKCIANLLYEVFFFHFLE